MKTQTQAANQLHRLVVTAPEDLRDKLRTASTAHVVSVAARFRVSLVATPTDATKRALRSLARRYPALTEEFGRLDREAERLVREVAPELMAAGGVGVDVAVSLLVACGDNPGRLRNEASLAHSCDVASLPVSSGRTNRHRLSRAGDRDANRALHMSVISRLRWDEETRRYADRRSAEGRTEAGDHPVPQAIRRATEPPWVSWRLR